MEVRFRCFGYVESCCFDQPMSKFDGDRQLTIRFSKLQAVWGVRNRRRLRRGSGKNDPEWPSIFARVLFCPQCPGFKYYLESNSDDYQFTTICIVEQFLQSISCNFNSFFSYSKMVKIASPRSVFTAKNSPECVWWNCAPNPSSLDLLIGWRGVCPSHFATLPP